MGVGESRPTVGDLVGTPLAKALTIVLTGLIASQAGSGRKSLS